MLEVSGAVIAWFGASLVVLGDGRRGLALGVTLAGAGMAMLGWQAAGPVPALALAAGGLVAAAGRLRSGPEGWQIMPAGSTPRIVLCIAAGLLSLWVALAITNGPGAGLRFAVVVSMGLAAARVLWSPEPQAELAAAAVLPLAIGAASAVGSGSPDWWPFLAGAAVGAAIGWIPHKEPQVG